MTGGRSWSAGDVPPDGRERLPIDRKRRSSADVRVREWGATRIEGEEAGEWRRGRVVVKRLAGLLLDSILLGDRSRGVEEGIEHVNDPVPRAVLDQTHGDARSTPSRRTIGIERVRSRARVVGVRLQDRVLAVEMVGDVVGTGGRNRQSRPMRIAGVRAHTTRHERRVGRNRTEEREGEALQEVGRGSDELDREDVALGPKAGDVIGISAAELALTLDVPHEVVAGTADVPRERPLDRIAKRLRCDAARWTVERTGIRGGP